LQDWRPSYTPSLVQRVTGRIENEPWNPGEVVARYEYVFCHETCGYSADDDEPYPTAMSAPDALMKNPATPLP